MADKKTPTAAEMLTALTEFAEDDISTMPMEAVRAQLVEEGVNLRQTHAELQKRLKAILGEERLQRAAAQRQLFLAGRETEPPKRRPLSVDTARNLLIKRLGVLQTSNPQMATAYFRNLDNATLQDMQQMLDDLDQLDAMSGEDTKR